MEKYGSEITKNYSTYTNFLKVTYFLNKSFRETTTYMPFGSGGSKEKNKKLPSNTHLRDSDHLEEISKITEMLNPDEKVLLVARQSRIKPGGSLHTPNVIYATDRRLIIRDPYMLGIKENVVDIPYDIVTSVKVEKGLCYHLQSDSKLRDF